MRKTILRSVLSTELMVSVGPFASPSPTIAPCYVDQHDVVASDPLGDVVDDAGAVVADAG
jgi:hypothetical protein